MSTHANNPQRKARLVGGEDTPLEQAEMLTEPMDKFLARLSRQYTDWAAFTAWLDERRYGVFALVASAAVIAALMALPASAQVDPCAACQAEHGSACPCLPIAAEPPGGTIPPVAGVACIPMGDQPDISGCDDKVFLPMVQAVAPITAQGGSGILPVRG